MKPLLLVLVVLLVACSTNPPTHEEQLSADYGPVPDTEELKLIIGSRLLDPYSAVYRIEGPCKGYMKDFGELRYGWYATAYVNAKNAYGGYVGEERKGFFFNKGKWGSGGGYNPPGC